MQKFRAFPAISIFVQSPKGSQRVNRGIDTDLANTRAHARFEIGYNSADFSIGRFKPAVSSALRIVRARARVTAIKIVFR